MKKCLALLTVILAVTGAGGQSIPASQSRVAGRFVAYNYGLWNTYPASISPTTGSQTFTVINSYVNLGDGRLISPFATNAPLRIGTETVTPSAVANCFVNDVRLGVCQITVTFALSHTNSDKITSATFGLQEALNDAGNSGGGPVAVDSAWAGAGGTTAIVNAAIIPAGTSIEDVRNGTAVGSGTVSGQTATCLPKASGASVLSSASSVCDNGSTVTSTLPFSAPSTVPAISPHYDATNAAYGAATGLADNSAQVNAAITAAHNSGGGAGGGEVYIPPGTFHFTAPIAGATNVSLVCQSGNASASDAQPTTLIFDGTGSASFISAAGKRGFQVKGCSIAYSSASYTGCLIDLSGSGSDGSMPTIANNRIGGVGGIKTATGVCVGTSGASDTIWIQSNLFVNLSVGIQGPTSLLVNANGVFVEKNYFATNAFAIADAVFGGQNWNWVGNVIEPSTSTTAEAAIKLTAAGVSKLAFDKNWCGDGSATDTAGVIIDTTAVLAGTLLNSITAHDNECSGFYSFIKLSSANNLLDGDFSHNNFHICSAVVDLNGATADTQSPGPGANACSYPVIDSSTGVNYPFIANSGYYSVRSPNIGNGNDYFENIGRLQPATTIQKNGFIGKNYGFFNYNPALRSMFNGFILPPNSDSDLFDPDFNGSDGQVSISSSGKKQCFGSSKWYCTFMDSAGVIHYRVQAASTSIAFTSSSTTATVVGPTTGLVNGSTYVISDPNVPAGTTGVYTSAGTTLALSAAATATTAAGSPITLTGCASAGGQITYTNSGTNGLPFTYPFIYITGFGANCAYANNLVSQVANESLSSSQFNIWRNNNGTVAVRLEAGTATVVPTPSTLWSEVASFDLTTPSNGIQEAGGMFFLPLGTATGGGNFNSNAMQFAGSAWNGSAAAKCRIYFLNSTGSGTNPTYQAFLGNGGCPGSGAGFLDTIPGGMYLENDDATDTTQLKTTAAGGNVVLSLPAATGTLALLASPTFSGTPAAPTATPGTNTTQIATTAFVTAAIPTSVLLNNLGPQTHTQSTGSAVTLATYTLPANSLPATGCVRVTVLAHHDTGATATTWNMFAGTGNIAIWSAQTVATEMFGQFLYCNNGSTSTGQSWNNTVRSIGSSNGGAQIVGLNQASTSGIAFTLQFTTAGTSDFMTLDQFTVERVW